MVNRIVSGGQTGVDRAALDFALENGMVCGGWVPKGRIAEEGVIPDTYPCLRERESDDPKERTELNVRDSDATLVITRGAPTGGSAFTIEVAARLNRPFLHIDLEQEAIDLASRQLFDWLRNVKPAVLNVAGPRSSEDREIYALTKQLLTMTFHHF